MNPGYAKPRSELPWLPYRTQDKVFVINSHNFGGGNIGFGDELFILRGPTGVSDQSGNGNDGTYAGGMGVVADTNNGGVSAFSFDGSDDRITASIPSTSTPFSIGMWKSQDGFTNGFPRWFDNGNIVLLVASTTAGGASSYRSGSYFDARYVNVANTWELIAFVFDGSTVKFYLNGTLVDEKSFGPAAITSFVIGNNAAANRGFRGKMDDIRISPSTWSLTQVSDWYTAGRGYNA